MDTYIIDLWNNNSKIDLYNSGDPDDISIAISKSLELKYIYTNIFDWERYHYSYTDIRQVFPCPDNIELYTHWIKYGRSEGRIAKKKFSQEIYHEFDYKSYQKINKIPIHPENHLLLYEHWVKNGINNPDILVSDVETINNKSDTIQQITVKKHVNFFTDDVINKEWIKIIKYEHANFNWKYYLNNYSSEMIETLNITTHYTSFIHWLIFGKKEISNEKFINIQPETDNDLVEYNTRLLIQSNIRKMNIMKNKVPTALPIYVINLSVRIDKKYEMIHQSKHINETFNFFPAYDGTNDIVREKYNDYKQLIEKNKQNIDLDMNQQFDHMNITNIGAMGLIMSTIELFKKIEATDNDHVIILEDDVQLHKCWNYMIKPVKTILDNLDIIYIGYNNHDKDVNDFLRHYNSEIIEHIPYDRSRHVFYGTYGYICSSAFRRKIINIGIDWFIKNNATLDIGYNILMWNREISGYVITGEHLLFPDIYDEYCINNNRKNKEKFYTDRFIECDNYTKRLVTDDVTFVFIIPSYNNEKWVEQNIKSIIHQSYKNWRIIYIDDNSNDNTSALFKNLTEAVETKCVYIHNTEQYGQAFNRYMGYNMCDKTEYCVLLDGDDWLSHKHVLKYLSIFITDNNLDMTYGRYDIFKNGNIVPYHFLSDYNNETIINRTYRRDEWRAKHLRVIKASLLQMINPLDFIDDEGNFLRTSTDMIESFASLELSQGRHKKIDHILMVYNQDNSELYNTSYYNDTNREYKIKIEQKIRMRKPYSITINDTVIVIDIEEDNYKEKIQQNRLKNVDIFITKGSELYRYIDRLIEYKNIQFIIE